MEITYLGHSCFRLKGRDATLVTDPFGPEEGELGSVSAEIVTVSHDHPGHANAAGVRGVKRVVTRPGEYEVLGVHVKGIRTHHDDQQGRERGRSVAYLIHIDDIVVCHLGDLGHVLTPAQVAEIGSVQVLFVPVGGGTTLSVPAATEVIGLLTPKIVIPMHYRLTPDGRQDLEPIDTFLRQMGVREAVPQPRLNVTPTNLPAESQVVVLEPRSR